MDRDDTLQPVAGESIGQQLRRAREQKGLEASDVADAQHLRPAVIHAIEDGDYDQIDSELFLKGYVRAYARQVGLDPNAIIASLDGELEPLRQERAQAEELNPLADIERRRYQKRRLAKVFFFVLLIAIVVFAGLRYMDIIGGGSVQSPPEQSQPSSGLDGEPGADVMASSDSVESSASEGSEVVDDAATVEGSTAVEESSAGGDASQVAGALQAETSSENENTVQVNDSGYASPSADSDSAGVAATAPGSGGGQETQQGQEDVSLVADSEAGEAGRPIGSGDSDQPPEFDDNRVPVVVSNPEPTFAESAQPAAAAGSARLEMTFRDECWVQVTDSAGNRLVGSLQRDGDRVEVSGRVPIDIVIGAVDAVETIRFDGAPVDLSNFRVVNNRSEFTLDI